MTEVLLRVPGGQIHRAHKENGVYVTFEGCNLDDAKDEYEVGPDALEGAEPNDLCENPSCFPAISDAA